MFRACRVEENLQSLDLQFLDLHSAAYILLFLINQMMQSEIADVSLPAEGFICNIVSGSVGVAEVPHHPAYSCPAGQYFLQVATAGTPCPTGAFNPSVGGTFNPSVGGT